MADHQTDFVRLVYGILNRDPADYPDPLAPKLFSDLGADSLDAVEITMSVEDGFEIVITDEEAEPFADARAEKTVGDWWALVEPKLAEKVEG